MCDGCHIVNTGPVWHYLYMRIPDTLNDTDLVVIERLKEATIDLRNAREEYGLGSREWHGHRHAVDILRAVLSDVGFDSDGIDHMIDDE